MRMNTYPKPGDIVASKSGTQYRVHFVEPDGRMGISPMSGKGPFRNMNAANATIVTPAPTAVSVTYTKEELWKLLAEAWESGYWHGTSHEGPLNDAAVAERNPYKKVPDTH